MDGKWIVEMIGYAGSALVVVSMLMTSVVKLRLVNTVGSLVFMCYALIIGSYPTALMNLCLIGINIYQLIRLFRTQKQYDLVPANAEDGFIRFFIEKNLKDIQFWFPDFSGEGLEGTQVFLASCDSNPASLLIGRQTAPGEIDILLDYAAPVYRDTTAGRFLYGQLQKRGISRLMFRGNAPGHVPYMERMGYQKNEQGAYVLSLNDTNRQ